MMTTLIPITAGGAIIAGHESRKSPMRPAAPSA